MRLFLLALVLALGCGAETTGSQLELGDTFGTECQRRTDCPSDDTWCSDQCGPDAPHCYQGLCTFECSGAAGMDGEKVRRCGDATGACSPADPMCVLQCPAAKPFGQCLQVSTGELVNYEGELYRCTNATQRSIPGGGYYLPCCCAPTGGSLTGECQDLPEQDAIWERVGTCS